VVSKFDNVDAKNVSPTAHFAKDLGLDSLDAVEVVMAIEDEFCVEFPDVVAEKIVSVPEAVRVLLSLQSQLK